MAEAVFDDAMKSRLVAFQKAHGLTEDGLVADKTWAKLAGGAEVVTSEPEAKDRMDAKDSVDAGGDDLAELAFTAENYPMLFKIAETCRTEQGVKEFLRDALDFDLDEVNRNMAAVLKS